MQVGFPFEWGWALSYFGPGEDPNIFHRSPQRLISRVTGDVLFWLNFTCTVTASELSCRLRERKCGNISTSLESQ